MGHSTKQRPPEERFWEKVDATGDCWEWRGARKPTGYGNFCPHRSRTMLAHRFAWETLVGPIPEGLTLDHMCRNTRCVNPDHLRPVTMLDNILAGYSPAARNVRVTACKHGHPLTGDNLMVRPDGSRRCVICAQAGAARSNATRRARRAA